MEKKIVRVTGEDLQTKAALIFDNWQETTIWSALQGVMGSIYVNHEEEPDAAMSMLGDFCFFAGEPDKDLVLYKPGECKKIFIIMVPQNESWARTIEECYQNRAKRVTRYGLKKEPGIFDREVLKKAVESLPDGYELKLFDESIYDECKTMDWSKDFIGQYETYADYKEKGLGVAVIKDGRLVGAASSYSAYKEGIEIEIGTYVDHRRKGLARACGAKLILECLDRGLYASWDAQNKWSLELAKQLGYHFDKEYPAYEITEY